MLQTLLALWIIGAVIVSGFIFMQIINEEETVIEEKQRDWLIILLFIIGSWFSVGMFLYTLLSSVDELSHIKRFTDEHDQHSDEPTIRTKTVA